MIINAFFKLENGSVRIAAKLRRESNSVIVLYPSNFTSKHQYALKNEMH